jgi:predicted negative regulator of RcsB-dependent stress response
MAVFDLEEQEQIAAIKGWWKERGKFVLLIVAIAAVTASAWGGWRWWHDRQAAAASELYQQLDQAARSSDSKKVRDLAVTLQADYGRTAYAAMAGLMAAKAAFETADRGGAKAQLQWVVDRAHSAEMRDVARLRLAGVLLDEQDYEGALKLLDAKVSDALAPLYADLKGDVLVAQGKPADARAQYQLALDKSDARSPQRQVLQIKLDALGSAQ